MADHPPSPHSELATFGDELRREREIRGISLKEIADSTKISKRFLEAIERNDHKTLPAPVFTRGFVREYARYLGLNAEEMVNRYNYAAAGDDRIEKTPHLERLVQPRETAPPPPPPKRGIPPAYARIDRNIYALVVIVVALLGVSWWALHRKRAAEEPVHVAADTSALAAPRPAPRPPPPPAQPPTPAPPDDSILRLTVDLTGDSWISLDADGKSVLSDELRRGEHRTFQAQERFRFRTIGNAGGVILTLNDVRLPPLGREGQVLRGSREVVLDRELLRQARSGGP